MNLQRFWFRFYGYSDLYTSGESEEQQNQTALIKDIHRVKLSRNRFRQVLIRDIQVNIASNFCCAKPPKF